jgi:hypothetical protein
MLAPSLDATLASIEPAPAFENRTNVDRFPDHLRTADIPE